MSTLQQSGCRFGEKCVFINKNAKKTGGKGSVALLENSKQTGGVFQDAEPPIFHSSYGSAQKLEGPKRSVQISKGT